MPPTVRPGTAKRLVKEADGFTLQIKVSDQHQIAAEAALEELRGYLVSLQEQAQEGSDTASPHFVSDVVRLSGGPFLFADAHEMSRKDLAALPDRVLASLDQLGSADAIVQIPRFSPNLATKARGVRNPLALAVFAPPASEALNQTTIPESWVKIASRWFFGAEDAGPVSVALEVVTLVLQIAEAQLMLEHFAPSKSVCLARRVGSTIRVLDFRTIGADRMILAVGRLPNSAEPPDYFDQYGLMLSTLRQLAETGAYGFLTVERDLAEISWYLHRAVQIAGAPQPQIPPLVIRDADSLMFDALPAHILGPKHTASLSNVPQEWIEKVNSTRAILQMPAPLVAWLPSDDVDYQDLVRRMRILIAPCLDRSS